MRTIAAATLLLLAFAGASPASEAETAARDFWKVFVQGDIAKLQDRYAEEVVLKAGSEFLKKEWGLNESGDRDKDKTVARADLMKAYSKMLDKIGKEKWAKVFGGVPDDKITAKVLENKHVLLIVKTGPGDDQLEYELAPNKDQTRWLVVSERTDY
jgi:deoxyribose-phosphate aldolase